MALARPAFAANRDLTFWKLMGSGTGEGFTPIPNTSVLAILCVWPSAEIARQNLRTARVFQRLHARAAESWTLFLATTQTRGAWSHKTPFEATGMAPEGALVALTRATIKPAILLKFWKRVPAISTMIGNDPNVAFKIGIGEVPWFHQVTFSIWPDEASMARFARTSGPHARAIQAVRREHWFREELYARFRIVGREGTWMGADPLSGLMVEHPA